MVYKPTRQAQTRIQPQNIPGAKGLFDQATAGQNVAKALNTISSGLMQQTYEAEETADVANAILEASKIVKPDGSIDPNLADAAGKVWSSRGMQTYMKSINGTMAKWSEGQLDGLKNQLLLDDPFGTNKQAKDAYETSVSELRSSLDNYPVAQADFDLRRSVKQGEIDISQAGEVQKRGLQSELRSAGDAAATTINRAELLGRSLGEDGVDQIVELYKGLEDSLTTIATSPLPSQGRGSTIRTLESQFQTKAATGVLIHRATRAAEISVSSNSRNKHGVGESFEQIAWNVENTPGYLESVMGNKLNLELADRKTIADAIRQEHERFATRRQSYLTEVDRPIAEAKSEFILKFITNAPDVPSIPDAANILDFAKSLNSPNTYAIAVELTGLATRKRNSLISAQNTLHTQRKRELLNDLEPSITLIKNGSRQLGIAGQAEETAAMQKLIDMMPQLAQFPEIRSKIAAATQSMITRDKGKLSDSLGLLEAQILSNGFGDERNLKLFEQGNELVDMPGVTDAAKASWLKFTSNHIQSQALSRLAEDIENVSNRKDLLHFNNYDEMREAAIALGGTQLRNLANAINAAESAEFGDNLAAARQSFETRFNPSSPSLGVTPAEGEEALNQIREKFKSKEGDSTFISMLAGLESRLTRYKAEHGKLVADAEFLKNVEEETQQNGVAGSEYRQQIEKLAPIPTVDLDSSAYRDAAKDMVARYGLVHSELLAYVDNAVMANEDQANRVLSFFNELIIHRADSNPNLSRRAAREQIITQLSDNSVAGRENAARSSGMLRLLFNGVDFESAKAVMIKGNTSSFNSVMKGAFFDYNSEKAESDPEYLFNYFVDQTVEYGNQGFWEGVAEAMGFKEQTVGELRVEQWFESQTNQENKQWVLTQFQADPNLKYYLSNQFKYHLVQAAASGTFNRADLEGAIYSTWMSLKGRVGVQMERVGDASFGFIARNTDLIPGNERDTGALLDLPGPIGVVRAGVERTSAMLGLTGDGVYSPRLTFRPIEPWLNSYGGVPAPLHSETENILRYDVAAAINNVPAQFFQRRGTTRKEVMDAINDGFIYYRTESLLGTSPGNPAWSVHVKVGGSGSRQTIPLFEEYTPDWNKISLSGVYDKAIRDGVSIGFGDAEFAKVYSYQKVFGEFSLRQAIRNEMQKSPDLSTGRMVINALNSLAGVAGYDKIEMSDENLNQYEQYFEFFKVR